MPPNPIPYPTKQGHSSKFNEAFQREIPSPIAIHRLCNGI